MSKTKKKVDLLAVKRGRMSRNKGKRGEREVANFYKDRSIQARRGVQFKGGMNSPDIIVEELDEFFHHEVKWVEKLSLLKAMEQCKNESSIKQVPLVVHKKNNTPWLVTLHLHDWINIIQRLLGIDDSVNTFPELKEFRSVGKQSLKAKQRSERREGKPTRTGKQSSADLL